MLKFYIIFLHYSSAADISNNIIAPDDEFKVDHQSESNNYMEH